jgi:hypothetical protein
MLSAVDNEKSQPSILHRITSFSVKNWQIFALWRDRSSDGVKTSAQFTFDSLFFFLPRVSLVTMRRFTAFLFVLPI